MDIACFVLGRKYQTLIYNLTRKFPPRDPDELISRLSKLAKKLNKLILLYALIASGKLSLPIKQEELLQELKEMNIDREFCLDKKEKAQQLTIAEKEALAEEIMDMSKISHDELIKMMLEDFDKVSVTFFL